MYGEELIAERLIMWGLGFVTGILVYIVLLEPTLPDDWDDS